MGKKLFNPVKNLSQKAHIKSLDQYEKEYNRSIVSYLTELGTPFIFAPKPTFSNDVLFFLK